MSIEVVEGASSRKISTIEFGGNVGCPGFWNSSLFLEI